MAYLVVTTLDPLTWLALLLGVNTAYTVGAIPWAKRVIAAAGPPL